MKNPTSSTENSNPGFAKSTQELCVRASGRQFLSAFGAFSVGGYFLRSMSRFTFPKAHKMTPAATRRPILSTAAVILSTRRASLWSSDAILSTGFVILQTANAILCTVGGISRWFFDILATCSALRRACSAFCRGMRALVSRRVGITQATFCAEPRAALCGKHGAVATALCVTSPAGHGWDKSQHSTASLALAPLSLNY